MDYLSFLESNFRPTYTLDQFDQGKFEGRYFKESKEDPEIYSYLKWLLTTKSDKPHVAQLRERFIKWLDYEKNTQHFN